MNKRKEQKIMKKKLSALLASVLLIATLSGCGNTNDNKTGDTVAGVSDSNSYATWNGIDRNKVVAHIEGQDSEKFDVTFGEFYSEYLYYLLSYNISDDMNATYKDQCESFREEIITYLR